MLSVYVDSHLRSLFHIIRQIIYSTLSVRMKQQRFRFRIFDVSFRDQFALQYLDQFFSEKTLKKFEIRWRPNESEKTSKVLLKIMSAC